MESIANSIIDVENGQEEEDLNKVAYRIIRRRKAVGSLATPSVLTMIAVFLLTNTILLLEEKKITSDNGIILKSYQTSDCNHGKKRNSTWLIPPCSYVDRFPISKEIDVRMCTDEKDIYVDIRRYTGQNATVEGIQLDRTQWTSLKRAIKHIDSAFN